MNRAMDERNNRYIPALRFHWLTPLYAPALRWLMREADIKRFLVEQMALYPGMRVLDLGCGTGTLVFSPLTAIKAVKPAGVGK